VGYFFVNEKGQMVICPYDTEQQNRHWDDWFWLLFLVVVFGCCFWLLFLVVVFGCCFW